MSDMELEAIDSKSAPGPRNDTSKNGEEEKRELWSSRSEFFLTAIGWSAVNIKSIWLFPYLLFRGGLGFLFIYLVLTVLVAMPMYYMELCLGQFTGKGPVGAWDIFPLGRGVGIAHAVLGLLCLIIYCPFITYSLYYFFTSFQGVLPWSTCPENEDPLNETWCSKNCTSLQMNCFSPSKTYWRSSVSGIDKVPLTKTDDFLENYGGENRMRVQHETLTNFGDLGQVKWNQVAYYLLAFAIIFVCVFKGAKLSGKVIYFIVPAIYTILFILFIFSWTLDGSADVYTLYTHPNHFIRVLDIAEWKSGLDCILYQQGFSRGVITMLGSRNKLQDNNSKFFPAIIIPLVSFITSIFCSFIILNFFGFLAFTKDITIFDVVSSGHKIPFQSIPETLSYVQVPQLWSALFFTLIFLMFLCENFLQLQTVLSCIYDLVPKFKSYPLLVTLGVCGICFLLGIPFLTSAGFDLLLVLDMYLALSFMSIAITEMLFIFGVFLRPLLCGSRSDFKSFLDFIVPKGIAVKIVWVFLTGFILHILVIQCWHTLPFDNSLQLRQDGNKIISVSKWSQNMSILVITIPLASISLVWAFINTLWYVLDPDKSFLDLVWPNHKEKSLDSHVQPISATETIPKMESKIPVQMDCPACQVTGMLTVVESEPTVKACTLGFVLLLCCLPFFFLPFWIFRKTRHRCPHCGAIVGQRP